VLSIVCCLDALAAPFSRESAQNMAFFIFTEIVVTLDFRLGNIAHPSRSESSYLDNILLWYELEA
jgi:hypothetical protein